MQSLSRLLLTISLAVFLMAASFFPSSASAAGWLYTIGNSIHNVDGSPWLAHGVNLADMRANSQCLSPPSNNPNETIRRLKIVAGWGANVVRIPMETWHAGTGQSEIVYSSAYLAAIKSIVDYATVNYPNMYIMLTPWHDPTFDASTSLPTANTDPVYQKLVDTFYSYPNVIFGIDNEPLFAPLDGAVWDAMNHAVQTIRNQEATHAGLPHLISVQARAYTGNVSYYASHPITAGNGTNVIYEVHVYDTTETAPVFSAAQNIPVIVGEYGPADTNALSHYDWEAPDYNGIGQGIFVLEQTAGFVSTCRANRIPFLAWAFSECDSPSMVVSSNGIQCNTACNTNVSLTNTSWGNQVQAELGNSYGLMPASVSVNSNVANYSSSSLSVNPTSVQADGNSTALITVILKSSNSNILPNQPVSIVSSGGNNTLLPASGSTDGNGVFTARLSSTAAEQKTIMATSGGVSLLASVTFTTLQPNSIVVSAARSSLPANGTAVENITISARGWNGLPLANAKLVLSSTGLDDILSYSQTLDANGTATATLHAVHPSLNLITATIGLDSATTTVTVTPAYGKSIVASPNSVPADGNSKIWLNVHFSTSQGSPGANQNVYIFCTGPSNVYSATQGKTDSSGNFSASVSTTRIGNETCDTYGDDDLSPQQTIVAFSPIGQSLYSVPQRSSQSVVNPNATSQRVSAAASN